MTPMMLAPWIFGKPAGEKWELVFVFVFTIAGLLLMYLFGRYWQE